MQTYSRSQGQDAGGRKQQEPTTRHREKVIEQQKKCVKQEQEVKYSKQNVTQDLK